jgi:hypothetical protein
LGKKDETDQMISKLMMVITFDDFDDDEAVDDESQMLHRDVEQHSCKKIGNQTAASLESSRKLHHDS